MQSGNNKYNISRSLVALAVYYLIAALSLCVYGVKLECGPPPPSSNPSYGKLVRSDEPMPPPPPPPAVSPQKKQ